MAAVTSPSKEEVRAVLLDHFSSAAQTEDPSLQNSRWHSLWESSFTPWDRGIPNPALEDLLSQRADLLGSPFTTATPTEQRRRKRALVPGCGRGYDVLLLASFGYDAYGLDVSASAVQLCETWAKEHGDEYKVRDDKVGRGQAKFIAADFFKDEWREELDGGGVDGFELIYDYTVGCIHLCGMAGDVANSSIVLVGAFSRSTTGMVVTILSTAEVYDRELPGLRRVPEQEAAINAWAAVRTPGEGLRLPFGSSGRELAVRRSGQSS